MLPRMWPIPSASQLLTVTKPHPGGWISAHFWRSGNGFRFVSQAIQDDLLLQDAGDLLSSSWIATIGKTTGLMPRGGTPRLIQLDDVIRNLLEEWVAEIAIARVGPADNPAAD